MLACSPESLRPVALHEAVIIIPVDDVVQQLPPVNWNILRFEQADGLPQMLRQIIGMGIEQCDEAALDAFTAFPAAFIRVGQLLQRSAEIGT